MRQPPGRTSFQHLLGRDPAWGRTAVCALTTPKPGNPRPQRRAGAEPGWGPCWPTDGWLRDLRLSEEAQTVTHLPGGPGPGLRPSPPARLEGKPGAESGLWLPRGGAARRTGHAQCAGPAPSAKRKRSARSEPLRRGMRNGLAWLLHPALPSTLRFILRARPPPAKRLCG